MIIINFQNVMSWNSDCIVHDRVKWIIFNVAYAKAKNDDGYACNNNNNNTQYFYIIIVVVIIIIIIIIVTIIIINIIIIIIMPFIKVNI